MVFEVRIIGTVGGRTSTMSFMLKNELTEENFFKQFDDAITESNNNNSLALLIQKNKPLLNIRFGNKLETTLHRLYDC